MNPSTHPPDGLRLAAMASRRSVVSLVAYSRTLRRHKWYGSAFVVRSDARGSILLACAHNLPRKRQSFPLSIRNLVGQRRVASYPASVIHSRRVPDVAFVFVPGLRNVPALVFAAAAPAVNSPAITVGYCNPADPPFLPPGCTAIPSICPGHVSSEYVRTKITECSGDTFDVTCRGMRGMSGSPVLCDNGVVGMVRAGNRRKTQVVSMATCLHVLKNRFGITADLTMEEALARV